MKKLTVKVALPPERLAKICREHGNTCGDLRFGVRVCPFAGASCPIDNSDKTCGDATAEDWEKVLQDEEPEPEFHFGDKVTHLVDFPVRGVFSAYKDSPNHGKTYAHVLFDGSPECEVVFVRNLKAGWE